MNYFSLYIKDCRLKSIAHSRSVHDIVLCVYERFRVDGDKNIHLLAFAFTIVFVWTGAQNHAYSHLTNVFVYDLHITIISSVHLYATRLFLL